MGRNEFLLWWLGITVSIVVLMALLYWIAEDLENEEEANKELYEFIEKYFGKTFLKIFKIFI